jgi:hypothetical protein
MCQTGSFRRVVPRRTRKLFWSSSLPREIYPDVEGGVAATLLRKTEEDVRILAHGLTHHNPEARTGAKNKCINTSGRRNVNVTREITEI